MFQGHPTGPLRNEGWCPSGPVSLSWLPANCPQLSRGTARRLGVLLPAGGKLWRLGVCCRGGGGRGEVLRQEGGSQPCAPCLFIGLGSSPGAPRKVASSEICHVGNTLGRTHDSDSQSLVSTRLSPVLSNDLLQIAKCMHASICVNYICVYGYFIRVLTQLIIRILDILLKSFNI